ncbi:MAG: hypothetical protein AAB719_02425 [Patescibacteria group bacterium]
MKSVSMIFGGEAKVKIMRLFIFNPSLTLGPKEVAKRIKERVNVARRELRVLTKAGLVRRRTKGFSLDPNYSHLRAIENFLVDATPITSGELIKKISRAGNIKLILTSGVFLHNKDSRVDILVVGTHLKRPKLLSIMASLEAELGKELRYAVFETVDFQYRLGIYDKLIRDILDYPHEKVLNKLGL